MAKSKRHKMPSRIARCALTDLSAIISVLIIGLLLDAKWGVPIALPFALLLAMELLSQTFPISTLRHETYKKSERYHRHVKVEIIGFGIWAAIATYISYLMFFGYHAISPAYIDTSNELYLQATTVAFLTLAGCQAFNILFVRADDHKKLGTNFLLKNQRLLKAYGVSAFLLLNAVYNPLFHLVFETTNIGFFAWISVIFGVAIYVGGRRLQRHTRKHTRHALIKLDKELRSNQQKAKIK